MKKLLIPIMLVSALSMPALSQATSLPKYLGEIFSFAGNFCPVGSLPTNGQLLRIDDSTAALFNLLGTTYGGEGTTNKFVVPSFALPKITVVSDTGRILMSCIVIDGWLPQRP